MILTSTGKDSPAFSSSLGQRLGLSFVAARWSCIPEQTLQTLGLASESDLDAV